MNTVIHKTVLLLVLAIAFLIACGPSVGRATGVTEPQGSENTESLKVEDSTPLTPSTSPSIENSSGSDKEITDGIWMLGTDISPGTYVTENHNNTCYWARLKGFSGGINDIIANGNPTGRAIVTITPGDAGFSSQKCGTWVLTEPYMSPEPADLNPTPMINDPSVSNSTMKTEPTQTMVPTSTQVSVPTQTMVPIRTKVPVPTATTIPTSTRIPTVTATSPSIPAPADKDLDDNPSNTILDGTWKVNEDIAPGTYESANSLGMCYWSRLSGFTGGMNDIIANGLPQGRAIVTILATDHGFSSLGCGKWIPISNKVSIQENVPEGTWIVGQDILEGTYQSNSQNICYWSRLSGFTGGMNDIIANGIPQGRVIVTILATDHGFSSHGCSEWIPVNDSVSIQENVSEGAWIVGQEILAGTYQSSSPNDCYWARLTGFTGGLHEVIANNLSTGNLIVSILETDIGFYSQGCGTWALLAPTVTPTPTAIPLPTATPTPTVIDGKLLLYNGYRLEDELSTVTTRKQYYIDIVKGQNLSVIVTSSEIEPLVSLRDLVNTEVATAYVDRINDGDLLYANLTGKRRYNLGNNTYDSSIESTGRYLIQVENKSRNSPSAKPGQFVIEVFVGELSDMPPSPTPTMTATPKPYSVDISGLGNTQSEPFFLEAGRHSVEYINEGFSNFTLTLLDDRKLPVQTLAAGVVGSTTGSASAHVEEAKNYIIHVVSDGTWSVKIR